MLYRPTILALLFLWILGCGAEPDPPPPPPATLVLHVESERVAERVTTAFARPPLLAPESSLVPGLFTVDTIAPGRIVLSPTPSWAFAWSEHRNQFADVSPRGNPSRSGPAEAAEVTAVHLRDILSPEAGHADAFRLHFIEAAARHNRGYAPVSSLGIETDGDRLILARADLRDVTVTAVPQEIETRLMFPSFSPPLGDETAGRLIAAGLAVDDGPDDPEGRNGFEGAEGDEGRGGPEAPEGPADRGGELLAGRLPEIIIVMVDGREHSRLYAGSEKEFSLPPREEREPVQHGMLEADGTRYDFLVANAGGEHLGGRDTREAVFDMALEALGVDSRGESGAVDSRRESRAGDEEAPGEVTESSSADDGSTFRGGLSDDAVIAVAAPPALAGRGEAVVSGLAREGVEARVHTDSWEAYRDAMFEGDFDLALLRWETESGSDGEVLRLFREYDPRNYAEWLDSAFTDSVGDGIEAAGDYGQAWERLGRHAVARRIDREIHQLEYELLAPDDHTIAPLELNVYGVPWFREDHAPGDPVPGDPVPGDPVPGDPVPGDHAPGE